MSWLRSVRSIITIMIVFAWCFAFSCGRVPVATFGLSVGSIITFYFLKERQENGGNK